MISGAVVLGLVIGVLLGQLVADIRTGQLSPGASHALPHLHCSAIAHSV
jgi:hypothetical protein